MTYLRHLMRCLHYSIIGSCHNGMEAVPERLSVYTRMQISEAATGGVLRNFAKLTGKHLCQSLSKAWPATLLKKETLAQVFFCEFYEISKNNCFKEPPQDDCSSNLRLHFHIRRAIIKQQSEKWSLCIEYVSRTIFY